MTRSPDILFFAEYVKNVLYFAVVRQDRILKDSTEAHYFTIDDQLIYENYYSDFGPLNLGCVYKYCNIVGEKLKQNINKRIAVVHYTTTDPKKKANAAFLIGCYGVIYLNMPPKDALKPLHGQIYRPFQDATQGDSSYTITLIDCFQAIARAKHLGFFNLEDFDYEEYMRLNQIQCGDLNWIVPGKFLAFIGPVDYSIRLNLYHPPEMYIKYFKDNDVRIVIRLNKKLYDSTVNAGITHYDLYFPDGSCPPRHILMKFLQISEETDGAIAVHCKAGLGRTGSLIGCYLIKHYRMTAHEAIAWMRICRPGSVIGHQQGWLERLEAWLTKKGYLYRKNIYHDVDRIPVHRFGVYSIAENTHSHRSVVSPSRSPSLQSHVRSGISPPVRPHGSKTEKSNDEDDEVFLTSCDLTTKPQLPLTQIKGCVLKTAPVEDENDEFSNGRTFVWRKYLCCEPCANSFWSLAVRCARITPAKCYANKFCVFFDMSSNKEEQFEWRVTKPDINFRQKNQQKGVLSRSPVRQSGAGEPRAPRSPVRGHSAKSQEQRTSPKTKEASNKNLGPYYTIPTFVTTHGPHIKSVADAKNFLMRSSMYNEQREKHMNTAITVTPQYSSRISNFLNERSIQNDVSRFTPSYYSTVSKGPTQPQQRRRLGRSPSPPVTKIPMEQSRATNTPKSFASAERCIAKDSKTAICEALSRLKVSNPRDDSIGAASLGARREAPAPRKAPSVRSDERPLATQGDLLNSIKFQRRLRDSLNDEKNASLFRDKNSVVSSTSPDKASVKTAVSKSNSSMNKSRHNPDFIEKASSNGSRKLRPVRPASPKGRRMQPSFY